MNKCKITVFSQISIDGKLTLFEGASSKDLFSLLNEEDIRFIHQFRGQVHGIMVGRKTITTDNPSLTNRYEENRNPVRIIPSLSLDFPSGATVLADAHRTIVVTTASADKEKIRVIEERGKECMVCGHDKIDFRAVFQRLKTEYSISRIMVEGGGALNWSLISENLVDELILMQLPIVIGGKSNTSLVDGMGVNSMDLIKRFTLDEVEARNRFLLVRYRRTRDVE